jgi:hypothetical protein
MRTTVLVLHAGRCYGGEEYEPGDEVIAFAWSSDPAECARRAQNAARNENRPPRPDEKLDTVGCR